MSVCNMHNNQFSPETILSLLLPTIHHPIPQALSLTSAQKELIGSKLKPLPKRLGLHKNPQYKCTCQVQAALEMR